MIKKSNDSILCARVTKNGNPCKKRALPRSDFCWMHYPRGYYWIPTIMGVVIGLISGFLIAQYYAKRSERFSRSIYYQSIPRTVPKLRSTPVIVRVGSNMHFVGPNKRMRVTSNSPYFVEIANDGKLLIHAEVRDKSGVVVVVIRDSDIYLLRGVQYDINSDNDAIEVIDESRRPILQAIRRKGNDIEKIIGEYKNKVEDRKKSKKDTDSDRYWLSVLERNREIVQLNFFSYIFSDEDEKPLAYIANDSAVFFGLPEKVTEKRNSLKCIFEYPGYLYPGQRIHLSSARDPRPHPSG